jgi:hypothetical protein
VTQIRIRAQWRKEADWELLARALLGLAVAIEDDESTTAIDEGERRVREGEE